ncbi:efflux RND transporter periplasmic adaptor subunit [Bryocella elongata]|uniref:efflux RND transporter periplasmic adaptor subunit n=1 Tax=Bryocella elongata TaxID=863522 RepID=UPI001F45D512|nr:efflux RND transporter periplasmic adaptor subunit [Bryocella elongata]
MKLRSGVGIAAAMGLVMATLAGCKDKHEDSAAQEAPPAQVQVESSSVTDVVHVAAPERFRLTSTGIRSIDGTLAVTGTVNPDVSREIPVLSLANGRVVALHVGLGDTVRKGQMVMEVQSPDVAAAFDTYTKAVNDEHLTDVTLTRDKLLYDKGAIAKSQLETAQAGEDDAAADLRAAEQQLRVLGVDKSHPADTVKVYAPASGVIITQNTTASGAAGVTYTGASGSFTIADLSHVWVVCDVYENDLAKVKLGDSASIQINAYPGKSFQGTVSDIGAVLDPTIRTAKVRIQVPNPGGMLRIGMFATATLNVAKAAMQTTLPSTAVLHLHDRDYVFVPAGNGDFRRVVVKLGASLDGGSVVVQSGLAAGQQVVANALELQNTADQG